MSERTTLPVLPLRETVIFPGTAVPISAGVTPISHATDYIFRKREPVGGGDG